MNPHPTDEMLLAALANPGAAPPPGEVAHWAEVQGDWLAAVAHADAASLVLLPAGGSLWGAVPLGQRRYLTLADQTWVFIAAEGGAVGPYQLCRLAGAADGVGSLALAREVCLDALKLLGIAPPPPASEPAPQPVSRRGFLRALTGRR